MRISDWSSDVCSSDLDPPVDEAPTGVIEASCYRQVEGAGILNGTDDEEAAGELIDFLLSETVQADVPMSMFVYPVRSGVELPARSEEHTSELQSLMRISYAVFCLKKKKKNTQKPTKITHP